MRTKSHKKNKINVVTLGCSKNIYDSEVLMGQLKANNMEVEHESESQEMTLLLLIPVALLIMPKRNPLILFWIL